MSRVIALLFVIQAGCFGTLPEMDTFHAAGGDNPDMMKCKARYQHVRKSYNSHASWTNRISIASIFIGAGTVLVNGISSKEQPGMGAGNVPSAINAEGKISGLELTGIIIASITAITGGFTTYEAKQMSDDTSEMDKIRVLIDRINAGGASVPSPGDLLECD